VGSVSDDAWDVFEKTGVVAEDEYTAFYPKSFIHQEKTIKIRIRASLLEDSSNTAIQNTPDRLGYSAFVKRETDAFSVFNNAFSTGAFAGPDGVALCSATHPANGGNTTNTGTLPLTAANLETTRVAMMNFTSDKGAPIGLIPDTILVPPALEATAKRLANSTGEPENANNGVKPRYGEYRVVTSPFMTDATNWFLIDSVSAKMSLMWFDRLPLRVTLSNWDDSIAQWQGRMRYSYGFVDWRWVYGHAVA
jgi:hypothetical protein